MSLGHAHAPCHRPRRRAIQYCRGADDQSRGRGVLDTRFRGYDDWAGLPKRRLRMRARANVTRRHRPRRRAIQYCRGADDQSRGRGVLDTRFRGYDDGAGLQKRPFAHASAGECHAPCHRPRRRAIQYCRGADDQSRGRGVLDTRFRGYDVAGPTTNAACLRLRARANVTRRVIAREGGRSSIAEELMINREAAAYWIPAFAGMTAGAYDKHRLFAHGSGAGEWHSPCHRPRRRAIQYCRGADDQSRGRGVLDTRFRGYDDLAGLQKRPFAHASAGECHVPSSPAKAGDPVLQRS